MAWVETVGLRGTCLIPCRSASRGPTISRRRWSLSPSLAPHQGQLNLESLTRRETHSLACTTMSPFGILDRIKKHRDRGAAMSDPVSGSVPESGPGSGPRSGPELGPESGPESGPGLGQDSTAEAEASSKRHEMEHFL